MIDVSATERRNRNRRIVSEDASRFEQTGQNDLFAIPFAQDNKTREIQFREGLDAFADKLLCRLVLRKFDAFDESGPRCAQSKVSNGLRRDPPQ